MATAFQSLRLTARSCRCQSISHRYTTKSVGRRRAFSTTLFRGEEGEGRHSEAIARIEKKLKPYGLDQIPGTEESHREYLELSKNNWMNDVEELVDDPYGHAELWEAPRKKPSNKLRNTIMNMGEDELVEEEEDNSDGITTLAHGELEAHREKRHYARLAAWEMPLLAKMAKPFVPPTADMPLRFRYTTYLGEQHPAEKKVVLEFCTADMPDLTDLQREKLQKLCGVRYNPETDIVKMSCEMFESQAQNKRYLGDRVDELLKEARDPTDTFEDVPLDTRHHTYKPKPKFPAAWRMTPKRQQFLSEYRVKAAEKDQKLMITGGLVDGVRQIEEAWMRIPDPAKEALPDLILAGKGAKGKTPKKVAMRR